MSQDQLRAFMQQQTETVTHSGIHNRPVPQWRRRLTAFLRYGSRGMRIHTHDGWLWFRWLCLGCGYESEKTYFHIPAQLVGECLHCRTQINASAPSSVCAVCGGTGRLHDGTRCPVHGPVKRGCG